LFRTYRWRESYVAETGKSMKGMALLASQEDCWRKISIALIDPGGIMSVSLIDN
jgi:hypothetical protein